MEKRSFLFKAKLSVKASELGTRKVMMAQLEEDFLPAILCAFINCSDYFNWFSSFGCWGWWLPAFVDGRDYFFEVSLVLVEVDSGGIICPKARFLSLHKGAFNFYILRLLVAEVPNFKCFVGQEGRSGGSGEGDAGRVPVLWPGTGWGFGDASRAILELNNGDTVVLDFDSLMSKANCCSLKYSYLIERKMMILLKHIHMEIMRN